VLDGTADGDGRRDSSHGAIAPRRAQKEGVRGRMTTFAPGRQRREQGAPPGELREEFVRTGRGLAPRETEDVLNPRQSFVSASNETELDHTVCQGFDRAGGVEATLHGESQGGR
jgi:hypothetical protein